MQKTPTRKRPCRICGRWFLPNPRLKGRQKTCGDPQCKREWHRKKCAEWNSKNADYFKSNYLQKKQDAATRCGKLLKTCQFRSNISKPLKSRRKSGLPLQYVQEVIGIQHLIIIEYLAQLLTKRFQEVIRVQHTKNRE